MIQVFEHIEALRAFLDPLEKEGKSIGFVPTMGALHTGHLALIRESKKDNDLTVCSIFVNPTQFNNPEDLKKYPRDFEKDQLLLEGEHCDVVFHPSVDEMYPVPSTEVFDFGMLDKVMEGEFRPGHFNGVATVVKRLFEIVRPTRAYFGQKDAQQVVVIGKMVKDLDFDLELVVCPIVREADGLAMSSRNAYLTPDQRAQAVVLSKALFEARDLVEKGERRADQIVKHIMQGIESVAEAAVDYISVVDGHTLKDVEVLNGSVLIAIAVRIGRTRLIDNVQVEV